MINFLLAVNVLLINPGYSHPTQAEPVKKEEVYHDFNIGKFLENNWVIIIGGIVFLVRLQNSVEDIKKDNQNKIDLLIKDFEFIKSSLHELRQQIDNTAETAKEDVRRVSNKLTKTQHKLDKFIEFVNNERITNSKPIFKINHQEDDDQDF